MASEAEDSFHQCPERPTLEISIGPSSISEQRKKEEQRRASAPMIGSHKASQVVSTFEPVPRARPPDLVQPEAGEDATREQASISDYANYASD